MGTHHEFFPPSLEQERKRGTVGEDGFATEVERCITGLLSRQKVPGTADEEAGKRLRTVFA